MGNMMENKPKRNSIIHVQNAYLYNLGDIVPNRETDKYIIGYQQKVYRIHYLLYKISKELLRDKISQKQVDINIREDFRWRIKMSDTEKQMMKNVTVRIVPTRYQSYTVVYAKILSFRWRRTGKGGTDEFMPNINECPMIANYNTVYSICYKEIGSQTSGGGTHGTKTYIVLSRSTGEHVIGKYTTVSNSGKTYLELPVRVML